MMCRDWITLQANLFKKYKLSSRNWKLIYELGWLLSPIREFENLDLAKDVADKIIKHYLESGDTMWKQF